MKLSHTEKQKFRRELKLKGLPPEVVERELKKKLSMDENTPVAPEATPEVAPESTSETTGTELPPEALVDTPPEPVA